MLRTYLPEMTLWNALFESITATESLNYAGQHRYCVSPRGENAQALFRARKYREAQAMYQHVLADLPIDETALRSEAYRYLGFCANLLGNFPASIDYLQKALQYLGLHAAWRHIAEVRSVLASSYDILGNFALAEYHIMRAIGYWESTGDIWEKTHSLLQLGLIKRHQGLFTEAETVFQQALTVARGHVRSPKGEAYALVVLGGFYQEQEQYQQSLTVTEEGLLLARTLKEDSLVNCSLCMLAMTYTLMGDIPTALFLSAEVQIPLLHEEPLGYEHALWHLAVGTIRLHQRQYTEAILLLTRVRAFWKTRDAPREYLLTTLRLAYCQLKCADMQTVQLLIVDVTEAPENALHYEHLVQAELALLPELLDLVKTSREMGSLRAFLHVDEESSVARPSPILTTRVPDIKIQAFGEPAVFLAGELVTSWHRTRTLELFFFLLEKGVPVRKEQIFLSLWPHEDERVDQTLRATIHYLRKSIGKNCVVTSKGTYALNLAAAYQDDIWYDVALFQQQRKRAEEARKRQDTALAQTEFLLMVSLYQGDFVNSLYSDWCRPRRETLRLQCLEARHYLAQIAWQRESFDESAHHWQQMLVMDACLEEAHLGLMRCYLRQGKRGLALRQYQHCCEILREELGLEPGPTLQNFYEQLKHLPRLAKK